MATSHVPMSDRSHQESQATVHSGSAGRTSSSHLSATPVGAPALPLSPPFSPQQRPAEPVKHHSRHSSLQNHELSSQMHRASSDNTKLEVNRVLPNEPTPPPSTSGAESSRSTHSRSNSVPTPSLHDHRFPSGPIHRTSVSATAVLPTASHTGGPLSLYSQQPPLSAHPTTSGAPAPAERPTLPPIQPPPSLPHSQSSAPVQAHYHPLSTPYAQQSHPQQQPQHPPQVQVRPPSPHQVPSKRPAPSGPLPGASPAKRQSKWTPEEDALIIELRGGGMKWEEISRRLPGRSAISCRLHYQNYLERRSEWDEERKNRLARLYERLKPEMWGPLAAELGIPWRAAEAMHWQLGEVDMARRAGVVPFSLAASSSNTAAPAPPPAAAPHHYAPPPPPPPHDPYAAARARSGSFERRPEEAGYPPRPGTMMGGPPPPPPPPPSHAPAPPPASGGLLPSLAELERGHAAYDERVRIPDPHMPRYPSVGGAYDHRR